MTTSAVAAPMTRARILLFAFCCGAIVGNLYYAQPIIDLIAPDVGLSSRGASLVVSLSQIGYALGLFFLVPLADLLENRKLMIATVVLAVASLFAAASASQPGPFLALSLLIGFSSVAVQILIPLAAHMAPEATRGRVVGSVMSGLVLGILLARPLSSLVADHFGWRAMYLAAAAAMLAIIALLALTVPPYKPAHRATYGQLLASLWHLFRHHAPLRERAVYQAAMFGCFSLFWTAAPLELARVYGLSQTQIALFALVGAAGAISAPLAGRWADAGLTRPATTAALALAGVSFLIDALPGAGVIGLALTGVVLDFAVQMNMVLGQRVIYSLDPASRARLNGLYVTSLFLGGAVGSALASPLYASLGWNGVMIAAIAVSVAGSLMHQWHLRR
ncbi:MFS transporter [Pseudomonas sp. KNUC1026]|uniref:MFS transporter n=1 Tax=Pseudomonas sp. KNUC1026 TaxID=2893890 RepID=UPI001F24E9C9|nr:MFS transporter [Pseudomonas sp. KNUC1026]UFH50951.1 MFS transporter [Pseudomonas sp. KNUC1026]